MPAVQLKVAVDLQLVKSVAISPDYFYDDYLKVSYLNHEGYIYSRVLHSSPEFDVMVARLAKNPATRPKDDQQNRLYNTKF